MWTSHHFNGMESLSVFIAPKKDSSCFEDLRLGHLAGRKLIKVSWLWDNQPTKQPTNQCIIQHGIKMPEIKLSPWKQRHPHVTEYSKRLKCPSHFKTFSIATKAKAPFSNCWKEWRFVQVLNGFNFFLLRRSIRPERMSGCFKGLHKEPWKHASNQWQRRGPLSGPPLYAAFRHHLYCQVWQASFGVYWNMLEPCFLSEPSGPRFSGLHVESRQKACAGAAGAAGAVARVAVANCSCSFAELMKCRSSRCSRLWDWAS